MKIQVLGKMHDQNGLFLTELYPGSSMEHPLLTGPFDRPTVLNWLMTFLRGFESVEDFRAEHGKKILSWQKRSSRKHFIDGYGS